MPRDASGAYAAPTNSANPAVPFTTISSADHNAILDDMETALSVASQAEAEARTLNTVLMSPLRTDQAMVDRYGPKIDALAALPADVGAVEKTGADTFAVRTIGGGAPTSLLTYAAADLAYQPLDADLTTIAASGVPTALIQNDAVTFAKFQNITTSRLLGRTTALSGDVEEITVGAGLTLSGGALTSSATAATGSVINSTYAEYTTWASLTTALPFDDTIPQITEGTQILSASITPSSTSNKVRIRVQAAGGGAAATNLVAAVFRGATANAICSAVSVSAAASFINPIVLEFDDSPATTSATTYTVRVAPCYLNGNQTQRYMGGTSRATIVLEEIKG